MSSVTFERRRGARRDVFVHGLPQALDEAKRPLDPLVRPLERLFGRGGEHGEQPRRIGAEFIDQRLRIHPIVLRFRHGDDAARLDLLAVGAQHGEAAVSLIVDPHLHVGGIEILDPAGFGFAEEHLVQHHPLAEQVAERLLEAHRTQFVDHPRPEAGIQEMQDGVLDAADVLIDRQPVMHSRIQHGLVVVAARKPQEIPRRVHEGVHGVGLAPGAGAAARAVDVQEPLVLEERIAAAVGNEIRAARPAVNHGNRAAPVALPRDSPVAQAPGGLLLAQAEPGEIGRDRIDGGLELQAVIGSGIDASPAFGVPGRPGVG